MSCWDLQHIILCFLGPFCCCCKVYYLICLWKLYFSYFVGKHYFSSLATTEYSSDFLTSYHGHVSPVNKIMWNPYHPLIFITCASEHVLYIWHRDLPSPILHFDLGSCVGDVAWAPYSSTVFAAVTSCGRVFIFDIVVSKYKPICKQVNSAF